MAVLVALMVVIGGVTRLTGSGLSMVEWRPLIGTLPPLTSAEWMRVFTLYQASPEYNDINYGMSLAEFKLIFFWEYFHRLWGRLLGLAFGLPLIYFAVRKMIPSGYHTPLIVLLILGGMQGVIGWWMVKSGLVADPTVSQYRLATHLSMALFIYGFLLWTGFNLAYGKAARPSGHLMGVVFIVSVTIIAGAFVAGMDAGLLYNEYPLMGEGLVPIEYGEEGLIDAFENPASAQFHHRWIAVLAVIGVLTIWRRAHKISALRTRGMTVGLIVLGQFTLGIVTLLNGVPVWMGAAHQLGAVLLLGATLWCAHGLSLQRAVK
jgi:cytochrome c oxidase assembly protein subunit 15